MPYVLHLRLLVPNSPLNCIHNTFTQPLFICMVDGYRMQTTTIHSCYQISLKKIRSHSVASLTSDLRTHSAAAMRVRVDVGERTQIAFKPQRTASLSWNYSIDEDTQVDCASEFENLYMDCDKESERRRKIGLANKGKEPWNKGRKHSAETRELIRQRTIEALRDPKVRQKMSAGHHAHSDESKARIGLGQKRVWRKRMILKSIKEKFYHIWAEGIAEAAKIGWCDQGELEWDSYEKLTTEMSLKQLQFAADKERAKTMAKLRAAREKAERMARRALLLKEKEEKEKFKVPLKKKTRKKPKDEIKEAPISKGLKLKARITKIRHKKSVEGQLTVTGDVSSVNNQPAIENLDLEFIKREKLRRELSLADQIQAAKKKRSECSGKKETQTKTSSSFIMNGRVEQLVSTVYSDNHNGRLYSNNS